MPHAGRMRRGGEVGRRGLRRIPWRERGQINSFGFYFQPFPKIKFKNYLNKSLNSKQPLKPKYMQQHGCSIMYLDLIVDFNLIKVIIYDILVLIKVLSKSIYPILKICNF